MRNEAKPAVEPLRLYVHRKTIRYTDYGEVLGVVHGIAWSSDGEDPHGFERGRTVEAVIARMAEYPEGTMIILEGRAVTVTCDMNPHGLI